MAAHDKWKANAEKVAFMKRFPGLTTAWEPTQGKTVATVIPMRSKPGSALLLFSDGSFVVAAAPTPEPRELAEGLAAARPHLTATCGDAYAEYDRLIEQDLAALRAARLENIVGAIHNNMALVPELKDRLKALVKEWA
ncbi:MAG: hypothetical protein U0172_05945 [Nitrospiraceae bacterium]